MKSELIVDAKADNISVALVEDGRLVSFQKESRDLSYAVGNIYVAKIKKIMPGLNAAFVNVGFEKEAFLHYLDLGSHFSTYSSYLKSIFEDKKKPYPIAKFQPLPDINKKGAIADVLTVGQQLLVQVAKEPISSKGPRLTTEISFTGRFLVLIPFSEKVSVSQKIKSPEEKIRLRQIIGSIKPKGFGVIIRTSAEDKKVAELNSELKMLLKCWEEALDKATRVEAPAMVFEEDNRALSVIRDLFNPSFDSIYVNDGILQQQIYKYVSTIAPEKSDIVELYTKDEPIFDHFSITRQIKSSFGRTVSFKSGAYIIIEHTEALHVIDVNSGNRTKADSNQESNALDVNTRAADEIARQLRLRDMGGIIVIDFIDMAQAEHRQALYEHMKEVMKNDRARHNILPLSKFGLMQITRQRVRPDQNVTTEETCPSCNGTGKVQSSLLFTDQLKEKIEYVINELGQKNFIVYVHPFVDAYIKKGVISEYRKLKFRLSAKFKIMPDESLSYLEMKFVDKDKNEISLTKPMETAEDESESAKTKSEKKPRRRKKKKNAANAENNVEQDSTTTSQEVSTTESEQ